VSIEESQRLLSSLGLIIIKDTFYQILDESACIWFAYAQHDATAMSFPIMVREGTYVELTAEAVYSFLSN